MEDRDLVIHLMDESILIESIDESGRRVTLWTLNVEVTNFSKVIVSNIAEVGRVEITLP